MGVGQVGIQLQGLPVGLDRLRGVVVLDFDSPLVPGLRGVGLGVLRTLHTGALVRALEGCGSSRQLGDLEIEQGLAGLGVPNLPAVAHHHVVALGRDADAGQGSAFRELLAEVPESQVDAAAGHARREEPLGRAQQDQVLEGEAVLAAGTLSGRKEAGAHVGADLGDRQAEQCGDVTRRIAARAGGAFRLTR